MGNPICLVQEPITAAMGFPLASARQSHRSSAENNQKLGWSQSHALHICCTFSPVEAFLCWNFRRYAFIPFLKSFKDKQRGKTGWKNTWKWKKRTANLISYVVVQHANHRCSFTVRDGVKDFIDLWWMAHVHLEQATETVWWVWGQVSSRLEATSAMKEQAASHLDGMTAVQSVQVQSAGVVCRHKLGPDVVFWEAVVHAQVLDPRCKSFIKPQMGPPFLLTHR